MNKNIIILFMLFTMSSTSIAQIEENDFEFGISLTVFEEHFASPFEEHPESPSHFGGSIALEITRKRTGIYQYTNIIQLGYYYHQDFNRVAFLAWKPKFEWRFAEIIHAHILLGLGYAHSFPTHRTYKLEDGVYVKKTNWGKSHGMVSLGAGAGVNLQSLIQIPIEVFGRYETFSLAPYALKGRIPITLNTLTSLGIKFTF